MVALVRSLLDIGLSLVSAKRCKLFILVMGSDTRSLMA